MMRLAIVVAAGYLAQVGTGLSAPQSDPGNRQPVRPVAIVSSLDGRVMAERPRHESVALEIFEWLDAGTRIAVQPGSRLTLIFANGTRVELGPAATATLGDQALSNSSGPIQTLPALPPLPIVSRISRSVHPPPGAAAIRVRGPRIERLLPSEEVTLADRTVLQFHAIGGPAAFAVEVEDSEGTLVFRAETSDSRVPIPAGVLAPGARYQWTVVARTGIGQTFRSSAAFATLPPNDQEARARFRAGLADATDARSLALLAEVDRGLNLLLEAREGFLAALALSPEDAAIRAALCRLEQQRGHAW